MGAVRSGTDGTHPPFFQIGKCKLLRCIKCFVQQFCGTAQQFCGTAFDSSLGVMQTWRRSFALRSMRNATISDVMDRVHSSSQNEEDLKLSLFMERF